MCLNHPFAGFSSILTKIPTLPAGTVSEVFCAGRSIYYQSRLYDDPKVACCIQIKSQRNSITDTILSDYPLILILHAILVGKRAFIFFFLQAPRCKYPLAFSPSHGSWPNCFVFKEGSEQNWTGDNERW